MHRIYLPAKLSLAIWFAALVFGAQQMSAANVTYIVGTCKSGTQFSTIQSALDASPAPETVEVCPGIYSEQVTITKPVTLEGITAANGSLVNIELPSGYTTNASVNDGGGSEPAIAQVYVNDVRGGSVDLINLNVNGVGFATNDSIFVGVLYNQSSGKIDQVTASAQTGGGATGVDGVGMWIQGGSSKPSVTVENSSVHDFSGVGILGVGESSAPDLTVTIKNNNVYSVSADTNDVVLLEGTDPKVSGNVVSGGLFGIITLAPTGSITGNTIVGSQVGIDLAEDGASVKANNIYNSLTYAIDVDAHALKTSTVENNTIRTVKSAASSDSDGVGIELHCNKISPSRLSSNIIIDAFDGFEDAPAGFSASNTYVGEFFDVDNGSCANGAVSQPAKPTVRLKLPGRSQEQ